MMPCQTLTIPGPLRIHAMSVRMLRDDGIPLRYADDLPESPYVVRPSRPEVELTCEPQPDGVYRSEFPGSGYIIGIPALPPGEFAVAADMCEEYGLAEVAKMLRACEGVQVKPAVVAEITSLADAMDGTSRYLLEDGTQTTGEYP